MKEIFENYVEHSFGAREQAAFKFKQFEYNYRKYFPEDKRGGKEGSRLLDIGIGRGEMLSCMKDWGYENYLGIDISPSTVDFCKSLNLPCELVEDSTAYLAANPDSFDVISLLDVLEHISKKEVIAFVKALRSALKPGGVLIIQVPNLQAPDGYLHRYNDITHEIGFIEHSLAQVLLAAGFKKFTFAGLEEFVFGTPIEYFRKIIRYLHWSTVRFLRRSDGNLSPWILNPVFFAIVWRD
jgi:2-polyprenyl-3-methyl-5-hydroxy-6-metoxy-1,4-benzoquinol methylase